jgi:hypothetical protein
MEAVIGDPPQRMQIVPSEMDSNSNQGNNNSVGDEADSSSNQGNNN